jgi:ankyrin repeat protein
MKMGNKSRLLLVLSCVIFVWIIFPVGKARATVDEGYCARLHEFSLKATEVNEELDSSQWVTILGLKEELFDGRAATPLFMAVHIGCLDTVELLLEKGADVHFGAPFMMPILYENPVSDNLRGRHDAAIARLLLEAGADVNQWFSEDCFPDYGYALHIALTEQISALHNRPGYSPEKMVQLLLEYGADVNGATTLGRTPLHWASNYYGKCGADLVRLLLETGEADVNAMDLEGKTPLYFATTGEITDILIAYGAQENFTKQSKEKDPLRNAILDNDHKLLKNLIKRGVDINSPDENGNTALHMAASGGYLQSMTILLAAGADVNIKNKQGLTPADMAGNSNIRKIIEGKDNFWLMLFSIRLKELGLVLGLLLAAVIHGLTWMLRQKKMAVAAKLGAVVGGISYAAAFIFLINPYVGEIHGPLVLILAVSTLAALALMPLHAVALQESFLQCFLAVYLDLGAGLYGSIVVTRVLSNHINRLFPWEGTLLYMFESSFRPALLTALVGLVLVRPLLVILLRKRAATA